MFRQFAPSIPGGAELLFRLHPSELAGLMEQAWEFRLNDGNKPLGHPDRRSDIPGLPAYLLEAFQSFKNNQGKFTQKMPNGEKCALGCVEWDHLIYAYMLENTRVYDIFRRVVRQFREGETLGVPLEGCEHWLRNTEELFYRDPAPFFIYSLTSNVRPSFDSSRRNAYYRMFGMDLNHGDENNKPFEFVKPQASNTSFVETFKSFLREVWLAMVNEKNTSGSNPSDDAEIANYAEKLHDMCRTRRISGNLAREEFYSVSIMSWFHLTLEFNSPIVLSLRAEGASPEQRLFKIAERVGLPAHAHSKSFFDMADAISRVLIALESGTYNTPAAVPNLYDSSIPGGIESALRTIITHWSITTGEDIKTRRLVVSPG